MTKLTREQRVDHLERAKVVRLRRVELRIQLRETGSRTIACEILANHIREQPDWLRTAQLYKVLDWIPNLGYGHITKPIRMRRLLDQAGIQTETRRLCDLTERQRNALAGALEEL